MNKIGPITGGFADDGQPLTGDVDVSALGSGRTVLGRSWRPADIVYLLGLLAFALPTMYFVATSTWNGEQGSYGPIILATGLWLVWQSWPEARPHVKPAPAWKVALLFALLAPLYLAFRITQIVEVEGYVMYLLLLTAIYGVIGYRAMRMMAFPLFYLLFAFPPPDMVIYTLTMPLKVAISSGVVGLLDFFGLPIGGTGVMIQIGQYQLLVAAACSGLNSIVSLSAITLFYIYMMHRNEMRQQGILLLFVLPVAIAANFIRVIILVLLTYYGGEAAAQGFLHDLAGITMFSLALLLIVTVDRLISVVAAKKKTRSAEAVAT